MPFDGVADVIGEYGDVLHLAHVLFKCAAFRLQRRVSRGPSFAVDEDGGVHLLEGGSHHVHGLDVMNGHQVEAEAVHMVFLRPIPGGVDDEVAHLLQIRCGLVAASGGVGVSAVIPVAVVIAGSGQFEVGAVVLCRVVVDHIHHHADSRVVESLDHLFHFTHARGRIGWIGGVTAFGRIVVLRVISPVVLVLMQVCLVHRVVVVRRKDMDVCHSQFLEVVDAGFLAEW